MTEEKMVNKSKIRLETADITDIDIEAFVYYASEDLQLGTGFGTCISLRGGPSIQKELEEIGYSIVIFPGGFVRALTFMATEYFSSLKEHGTTKPYQERMLDLQGINDLLGTEGILEAGGKYDAKNFD